MPSNKLGVHCLGKYVRRVLGALNLVEREVVPAYPLLHPELPDGEVPYLANTRAPTDADGGATVGVDLKEQVEAKVGAQAGQAQALPAPLTTPASSASPELNAMTFCVVAQCLITWAPRQQMPPEVDLRVVMQPAKSVSTQARRSRQSSCQGKS